MPDIPGPLRGGRVACLFILVRDFRTMASFYRDLLGFEAPYYEEGKFAFLRLKEDRDPEIALYAGRESEIAPESHWFVMIDVEDIERTVAVLRERGVEVGAIEDVPYGRAATFKDPEGNVIEIHQPGR